nr:MAG TPA: hypothetical protein [Caudoviricetes sp.]
MISSNRRWCSIEHENQQCTVPHRGYVYGKDYTSPQT